VTGLEHDGLPDGQLALKHRSNMILKPALDLHTKEAAIGTVNSAIHIAEAVGRTDDGIRRGIENIFDLDVDVRNLVERSLPG
jgi:phage regulator Rha-like protein